MRAILLLVAIMGLIRCARPYGPAEKILNQELMTPNNNQEQTKIAIIRNEQFIGGGSGGMCKFLIAIDDRNLALLRQNQFVTAYLDMPGGSNARLLYL